MSTLKFFFHHKQVLLFFYILFYLYSPILSLIKQKKNTDEKKEEYNQIISIVDKYQLYKNNTWLNLLHYKKNIRLESEVKTNSFFLSPLGKKNPREEMLATIMAFLYEPQKHCKYPARKRWIEGILNEYKYPFIFPTDDTCSNFIDWKNTIQPDTIKIVLASASLDHSESLFGHLFLLLENKKSDIQYTLTFSAEVPLMNTFEYVIQSIFTKFNGFYELELYSTKKKQYVDIEKRTLSEWNLKLKKEEILFILEHLWELRSISLEYRLFNNNCASRLFTLLSIVSPPWNISNKFGWYQQPIDSITQLYQKKKIEANSNTLTKQQLPLPTSSFTVLSSIQHQNIEKIPTLYNISIRFTPAFKKIDELSLGYSPYFQLDLLSVKIHYTLPTNTIQLSKFTLLNLLHIPPIEKNKYKTSWATSIGFRSIQEQSSKVFFSNTIFYAQGGAGWSIHPYTKNIIVYLLNSINIEAGSPLVYKYRVGSISEIGFLYRFQFLYSILITAQYNFFFLKNYSHELLFKIKNTIRIRPYISLELSYHFYLHKNITTTVQYYQQFELGTIFYF